jgi:3-dehydroquinate synthetase
VLEKFEYDKKHQENAYRVVIPNEHGRLELVTLEKTQATRADIRHVYQEALSNLGWSFH